MTTTKKQSEEKKPKLKFATPKAFVIELSGTGTDVVLGRYMKKKIEDKSALMASLTGVRRCVSIVGKEQAAALEYDLAIAMLSSLEHDRDIIADLEAANKNPSELIDRWTLKTTEEA